MATGTRAASRRSRSAPVAAPAAAPAAASPDLLHTVLATVVGSYPTPEWLRVHPTRDSLRDATLVVVRTQEAAGVDVLSDGELSRFDVNHPETNGMIDYFVGQMDGVSVRVTAADAAAFAAQQGMAYRSEPA